MDEVKQQEALHYIRLQQYKKAQEFLKSCLRESPNDGYAMYLLATCLNDAGDYKEALDCALDCLTMEDSGFAFSKSAPLNSLLGAIYVNGSMLKFRTE